MRISTSFVRHLGSALVPALAVGLFVGCQSRQGQSGSSSPAPALTTSAPAPQTQPAAPAAAANTAAKSAPAVIRIRAGNTNPLTDASGNVWLADQGFADGETILREGDLKIENTPNPNLYRSERYSMSTFSWSLANGPYTVKLHFAETFEEINGPGQRVFSFAVNGKEFNDFDVWVKAGGKQRAYIETVPVTITNGKLEIKFSPKVQNPEINGIEILPGA
jgi:hypothetical protein